MRNQEWDAALAQLYSLDLAQLVLCLLFSDAVDGETALGVVDETEVLASLLDGDDVHVAGWVGRIGADLAIDLDQALHDNRLGLAAIEGVLQTIGEDMSVWMLLLDDLCVLAGWQVLEYGIPVANEDDQRHAVAQLVRTWRGLGRIATAELVEQPVRWR